MPGRISCADDAGTVHGGYCRTTTSTCVHARVPGKQRVVIVLFMPGCQWARETPPCACMRAPTPLASGQNVYWSLVQQRRQDMGAVPPRIPYGDAHALVIVEPRAHPLLQAVLQNVDANIPPSWVLYLFHGVSNRNAAAEAVRSVGPARQVVLTGLSVDNLSPAEYNRLFTTSAFWEVVHAENVLVFQTDAMVCSESPYTLDAFTQFPYIGCPYTADSVGKNGQWGGHSFYGVGGLSFRKRSFMLRCIARAGSDTGAPEDVLFSDCVDDMPHGHVVPTPKDLAKFCSQARFKAPSFGVHKPIGMSGSGQSALLTHCPEAAVLLSPAARNG